MAYWASSDEERGQRGNRSNRARRLLPAYQGMKNRSCGLVQRIGTVDSAAPHPDPCGGQAPALQDSGCRRNYKAWPLEGFGSLWSHPSPLDSGLRRNDPVGIQALSRPRYQSLIPDTAGTPKYEKPELWLGTANWHDGFCHAPPRPLRGTSPRATFSHSAIDHRSTVRRVSPAESGMEGDWSVDGAKMSA